MALVQIGFHSDVLGKAQNACVVLPASNSSLIGMRTGRENVFPSLWLLHGLSDDHSIWMRRTSVERYASEYGVAVVMPSAEKSWYCDMKYGDRYFTYITEELPDIMRGFFRGMSDRREYNCIAGLSMGGYGALKAALTFPGKYRYAASFSGALDIAGYVRGKHEAKEPYWYSVLGEFDKVPGGKDDLFAVAERAFQKKELGEKLPEIYMWCGTSDRLFGANLRFKEKLESLGIENTWSESEGDHEWSCWDRQLEKVMGLMFRK